MSYKRLKKGFWRRKARAALRGVMAIAKSKAVMVVSNEKARNVEFSL